MSDLSGPFAAARREVALVKEKMVSDAQKMTSSGTIPDKLNDLLHDGVIDHTQYHDLFFTNPLRVVFEIALIEKLEEKGASCADNGPLFEEVQQAGSQYFFENHSPLARHI